MKFKNLKYIFFTLIVWAFVASCATSRRCSRKFPPQIHTETIIKDTTIITETTRFDTIFNSSRDTVFLFDKETQIRIKYLLTPGDSVFIEAECPPDTVTITTQKTTNNVIHDTKGPGGWYWILFLLVVSGLVFGVAKLVKHIKT